MSVRSMCAQREAQRPSEPRPRRAPMAEQHMAGLRRPRPSRPTRSSSRCRRRRAAAAARRPSSPGKPTLTPRAGCRRGRPVHGGRRRARQPSTPATSSARRSRSRASSAREPAAATSTAAAKPATAATSSVPERTSRSWPPPCSTAVRRDLAAREQRADAVRSAQLVRGEASAGPARCAAKSTGTCPTACTASLWDSAPYSAARAATSATGCRVPTSLLAHITETTAVRVGRPPPPARPARPGRLRVHRQLA